MRSIARIAILLVPLAFVACEDGSGPEPRTPESMSLGSAAFTMNDGDTLQLTPNVYDQNDSVFASIPGDLELTWSSLNESIVGVAQDGRLFANGPGTTQIRVDADNGMFATAGVTVHQVASTVGVVLGNNQNGLPGAVLTDSVSVRVLDRHGNGVGSVPVHFRVVSGGGTISPDSVRLTNSFGIARVRWTLGPEFAAQQIEAQVDGLGAAVPVHAAMAPAVVASVDIADEASAGGTLAGAIRLNSSSFTHPIGAAHVVVSWDPAVLQLQPASITNGDYGQGVRRLDNAAGELHIVSSDPTVALGDLMLTVVSFDVVGAVGSSTAIEVDVEQLVRTTFQDVSTAAFAVGTDVTIN